MALYFSPPTAPTVPMWAKRSHPATSLFIHYRPMDASTNVFVVNGVVTTVEPDYEFVKPDRVYLGGHLYTITDAEAALLTAAGYTVLEGAAAVIPTPLPGAGTGSDFPSGFGLASFASSPFGGTGGLPGSSSGSDFAGPVGEGLTTPGVGVGLLGVTSLGGI